MANIALSANTLGTGTFTISAPNTNTDRTLTLPDATTTIVGTDAIQTLTNKTLGSGLVAGASLITSATAQASTSGTNIDFIGIPSWVKRITVMFNSVSASTTAAYTITLGTGATPTYVTSGYNSYTANMGVSALTGAISSTAFIIATAPPIAYAYSGAIVFTNLSGNVWVSQGMLGSSSSVASNGGHVSAGGVDLGAQLTAVRISSGGFDAGSINIFYE